jgi:predicted acylesterase/phospholipase RssA
MKAKESLTDSSASGHPDQAFNLESALNEEVIALAANPGSAFFTPPEKPTDPPVMVTPIEAPHLRRNRNSIGLALSGGGIRSATFSLGVLQALAAKKKLASFDYLSTVSGGGYIGSWLSAWIYRKGLRQVQDQLGKSGNVDPLRAPASSEPAEIVWLRRYSNYLTPRVGMLSMDVMTLIATWLRNVTLNLIVLLSFFALLFTLPYVLLKASLFAVGYSDVFGVAAAWSGLFFVSCIAYNLWHQGLPIKQRRNWLISTPGVALTVVMPGLAAIIFAVIWWARAGQNWGTAKIAVVYLGVLLLILLAIWITAELISREKLLSIASEAFYLGFGGCIALLAGVLVLTAAGSFFSLPLTPDGASSIEQIRHFEHIQHIQHAVLLVALGVPIFLASLGVTTTIFTGIVGRAYFERSREWWSRLNAWLILIAFGWAAWCLLTFFSLPLLEWIQSRMHGWITVLLGTGWIGSLLVSIFMRRPESASAKKVFHIERWLNLAATVFVAGLLFVTAAITQKILFAVVYGFSGMKFETPPALEGLPPFRWLFNAHAPSIDSLISSSVPALNLTILTLAIGVLLIMTLVFAWRVDINKFSLHNMYKNRLIRCYLGASNQKNRNEQPFVGLDDRDDFSLSLMGNGIKKIKTTPQLPFHIINATLNITQGANLAWQERKAASFVFTPLCCGYSLERTQGDTTSLNKNETTENTMLVVSEQPKPAYRTTREYASQDPEEEGFTLGMALATSGAAVSPNMGRASLPMLAFILTMFNIRLGRWSPNPAGERWRSPSPKLGLVALLQELLGHSDERSPYVYLSDGGHFDNLGIYELIRRRCSVILAVDASADANREMSDLADTVRKCRVDLGVDISFKNLNDYRGDKDTLCERGYITGTIQYDAETIGTIILIKPSMMKGRDESVDIINYAIENPTFPHQTTVDQFFDESQFESFRQLGKLLGDRCLNEIEINQLLPDKSPAPLPERAPPAGEGRGLFTKILGALLTRRSPRLPGRDNALVDIFVVLMGVTIVVSLLFIPMDKLVFETATSWCWSWTECRSIASQRLTHGVYEEFWNSSETWRLIVDNFFILLYTGAFICGYVVAGHRKRIIWLLLLAPLLTALSDYAENFISLTVLFIRYSEVPPELVDAQGLFSAIKFCGFIVSLVILVFLSGEIYRVFMDRWRNQSARAPGNSDAVEFSSDTA